MTTKTSKYVDRMKSMIEACKLNDEKHITVLRLLAKHTHSCDLNLVSDGSTLSILPSFMK